MFVSFLPLGVILGCGWRWPLSKYPRSSSHTHGGKLWVGKWTSIAKFQRRRNPSNKAHIFFSSISRGRCFLNQGQGYGKSSLIKPAVSPSRALYCVHLLNYTLQLAESFPLAESFLLAPRFYLQVSPYSGSSNLFHSVWKHHLYDFFPGCLRLHSFSLPVCLCCKPG